jgi:hypothetical protein
MPRRPWTSLLATALPTAVLLAGLAACSGGDDDDDGGDTARTLDGSTPLAPPTTVGVAATAAAPTAAATTTQPSLTSPASVVADTEALGSSSLSTVDLASGATTRLGSVGTEVGVLGIAVAAERAIDAVTDAPALLALDLDALDADVSSTPVDAGGATLLALARRPGGGGLVAIADSGAVVALETDGTTQPLAEVALDDPGVGLDVTADGTLEVVVATGAHHAIDLATGAVTDLPTPTRDEAVARIVAIAHAGGVRYGIDAAVDELVTIGDDGAVATIGPLGLDVTDGASLDIGPDGVAVLANPG